MTPPQLSVVVCTWNRAAMLQAALAALTAQAGAPSYEILVIDNGSTDGTPNLVARDTPSHVAVRFAFEPRLGLSHARNTGIELARGSAIAFTDDDVRVGPDWVRRVVDALAAHPDAACVGGPVSPQWPAPPPSWLSERHWAPLGIQEYGPDPFRVDSRRPVCLIGANLVVRREALVRAGGFEPALQRVGSAGGSTEDHALHVRLWRAGLFGMYVPALRVAAVIGPERLRKAYHRAWHYGHGRHVARMGLPWMESSARPVLGVPGHLVRQAAADTRELAADLLRRDPASAFDREARLWFAAGFVRERWT